MASPLNPAELRAWRAFLNAQASLLRRLEAELVASEDMTLAEFDVLVQLRVAPDQRLRMNELSEHVRLSPSGITRLVDRMVEAGLVERGPCAEDRRVTWAILLADTGARRRSAVRRVANLAADAVLIGIGTRRWHDTLVARPREIPGMGRRVDHEVADRIEIERASLPGISIRS